MSRAWSFGTTDASPKSALVYRVGDCQLEDSDTGRGAFDAASGAVACTGDDDRLIQWYPLAGESRALETEFSTLWQRLGDQVPFDDSCRCAESIDNAAGLSWSLVVPPGGEVEVAHRTVFSPQGLRSLPVAVDADHSPSIAGAANTYDITISNPNVLPVSLSSVDVVLPAGFSYRPGTTSGVTTSNPAIAGQRLRWSVAASIPPHGSVTLHAGVTTADEPGSYVATASAR